MAEFDFNRVAETVHLLPFVFPGELKIFASEKQSDAVAWASGQVTEDAVSP